MEQNYLLHYTKTDSAINYILKNKTLRFNSFRKVNDPKESKHWPFKLFCFYKQNFDLFSKNKFHEIYDYIMNHIFMSCFSINSNPFENNQDLRMWSQYGDNHTGVCLIFNKEKLENDIIQKTKDYTLFHEKIEYSTSITANSYYKKYPEPGGPLTWIYFNNFYYQQILPFLHPFFRPECSDPYMINLERLNKLGTSMYMQNHINYFHLPLFFTKNNCWKDESEYRFVIHTPKELEFIDIPITNSIEGIILGNDFPSEHLNSIISIAENLNIRLFKLYSRGWYNHLIEVDYRNQEGDIISLLSSFPINFYYDELFYQVCDINGKNRTIHINSSNGNVTLVD